MVYHLPGSPSAKRVSLKNRVLFKSAEEAEKAGFRKANQMRNAESGMRNYEKQNELGILKNEASPPTVHADLPPPFPPCRAIP